MTDDGHLNDSAEQWLSGLLDRYVSGPRSRTAVAMPDVIGQAWTTPAPSVGAFKIL